MADDAKTGAGPAASRRAKYTTMLAIVIGAGLALLASTQPWITVQLAAAANHAGDVVVQGSAAAPALTALSLAGLALAAALAIAGPIVRIVLAVLGVLIAVSITLSAGIALGDPVQAAAAAITGASGVSGGTSVARLAKSVDVSLWPWIAILGGVVIAAASIAVILTSRRWPGPSRRYQAVRFEDTADAAGSTGPADDGVPDVLRAPDPAAPSDQTGQGVPIDRDTAIDSWDELSRGEDPTR
ncbi:Trp biosynthesis-associated membrane protein [Diaminobutyricibacter tongyongensis]|uniref:Trp biosynthesis-associated membrane protein n=2 Tax=Leifsonia tongyongensis TaxID=1268043 RepID=A0A6L9XYJ2_9MICO|nr:Trp biosynthesis-associated membrane protein [Diaminobutyricibacter tongyongensis]